MVQTKTQTDQALFTAYVKVNGIDTRNRNAMLKAVDSFVNNVRPLSDSAALRRMVFQWNDTEAANGYTPSNSTSADPGIDYQSAKAYLNPPASASKAAINKQDNPYFTSDNYVLGVLNNPNYKKKDAAKEPANPYFTSDNYTLAVLNNPKYKSFAAAPMADRKNSSAKGIAPMAYSGAGTGQGTGTAGGKNPSANGTATVSSGGSNSGQGQTTMDFEQWLNTRKLDDIPDSIIDSKAFRDAYRSKTGKPLPEDIIDARNALKQYIKDNNIDISKNAVGNVDDDAESKKRVAIANAGLPPVYSSDPQRVAEEATAKTGIRSWDDADFFTDYWYHDANKLRRALEYLKAEVKKNGGMLNLTAKELPVNFWVTIQAGANAKIAGEKTDETLSKVSIWQLGLPESEKYNYGQIVDEATVDKMIGNVDAMNSSWQKPLNDAAKIIEIGHLDEDIWALALAFAMGISGKERKINPYDEIDDILAKEGTVAGEAAEEAAAIESSGEIGSAEGAGKTKNILNADNKTAAIKSAESLPSNIRSKVKDFFKGGSNSYIDFSVEPLEDGSYIVKMTKPGNIQGSKAIYYKVVDANGNTIRVYKETYDPAGNLIHVKDK